MRTTPCSARPPQAGRAAITFRSSTADEVFDLLARGYGLTRRERQLVALMLDGLAAKQLAAALSIPPNTVQDHRKAIFGKTRLRSRRELVSHLAGRSPEHHMHGRRNRLDAIS
jgi:DNA-binding CsgD family transcriptional regulator